jgi:hypothetical protein
MIACAAVGVAFGVPESSAWARGRIDVPGALLLSAGLVGLLGGSAVELRVARAPGGHPHAHRRKSGSEVGLSAALNRSDGRLRATVRRSGSPLRR